MKAKSFTLQDLMTLLGQSYYFVAKTDNVFRDRFKNLTIRKDEYGISGSVCGYVKRSELQSLLDSPEFEDVQVVDALAYLTSMN